MVRNSRISIQKLWDEVGFSPNDEQKRAILHTGEPLYLPSGPGSGKTRVLLWRTLNLIVFHNVSPDEVFLSTFTEKAAFKLREGLRALLGAVTTKTNVHFDVSNMYVGTVHSLCRRIMTDRRFARARQRRRAALLLDDLAQYLYLYRRARWDALTGRIGYDDGVNEFINTYLARTRSQSKHSAVTNCTAFFNRLSEECIDPEVAREKTADGDLKVLLDLYKGYTDSLIDPQPMGTVDLSLLQRRALDTVLDCPDGSSVFRHVIIDEYQDTNPIQERLFFELARGHRNICAVGDDDQGLYRFRGATIENFVQFPDRCRRELGSIPREIRLTKNYRSRRKIVAFYNDFISTWDWTKRGGGRGKAFFRVEKEIEAVRAEDGPSVVASSPGRPGPVCREIAGLVRELIDAGKVSDPNQIAFVFPSLKSVVVKSMIEALETEGLEVYAPRAGRFMETAESEDMFGVLAKILGRPGRGTFPGRDYSTYHDWLDRIDNRGRELMSSDPQLTKYVKDRQTEIGNSMADYQMLLAFAETRGWDLADEYNIETMKRSLVNVHGLSQTARRNLSSTYFDRIVRQRIRDFRDGTSDREPFRLGYIIRRATAMDWSLLDLFYRICGFQHFRSMFDLAEQGRDEGPIANLGLISQYLERFIEQYTPVITAEILTEDRLQRLFFGSYLFAIYRRGESEYEDAEDPFPKGRIPFITIHQAKGLEFPVVVLGSAVQREHAVRRIEEIVEPLVDRKGEPLDRMDGFDRMRMFYVALSRAQNLLVIADHRGQGYPRKEPFLSMLNGDLPRIPDFDVRTVPEAQTDERDLPKNYSYTADYLFYLKCPRQYMIFRKYGFVESRSTTMFFGSLVHETLADLHEYLIAQRQTNG